MKIAILYICTGRYNQFFDGFYKSAEKYLLHGYNNHYFIWTDDDYLADGLNNVTIFHKECAGFPADSLFRFEMFLQAEEELKKYDYVYFFNSNAMFLKPVDEEILPDETGLAMGIWRGIREHQHPMFYPYERNKRSLAYVEPYKSPYTYFMGGLNGGTAEKYLEMVFTLSKNIRDDYERGIIAKYHDESHINAYMRTHSCKIISGDLNRPEESMTSETKMIFRKKTNIDPYFNKNRKFSKSARIKKACGIVWDIVRWYLKL
ncbi:hypothetical protein A9168_02090 [Macellibacteroides sp. HH-ZS]|nr:hypothetical protein A9168_02090 [Macellibacteroides sp. HH-ZS]